MIKPIKRILKVVFSFAMVILILGEGVSASEFGWFDMDDEYRLIEEDTMDGDEHGTSGGEVVVDDKNDDSGMSDPKYDEGEAEDFDEEAGDDENDDIPDDDESLISRADIEYYNDSRNIVIVYTYGGLEAALHDSAVDEIHLGADITLSKPIKLEAKGRTSQKLVLDGTNPKEVNGRCYQLTENSATPEANLTNIYMLIGEMRSEPFDIYVQNIKIYGYNFYGTIQPSVEATSKYTIHWINVDYNGAQPIWWAGSRVFLEDSSFTLREGTAPGEVGEATHFVIDGMVRIQKERKKDANEIFYIRQTGGGITINEGASLIVNNESTVDSTLYHSCDYLEIGRGAVLDYSGYGRINGNSTLLSYVNINEGANVRINIKGDLVGSQSDGPLKADRITVGKDSVFHVLALDDTTPKYSLIYANYLYVDEPKSMVVITNNQSADAEYAIRVLQEVVVKTDEARHWKKTYFNHYEELLTGNVDDHQATHHWYNKDGTMLQISGIGLKWEFENYEKTADSSPVSDYGLKGANAIIYQKLSGLRYEGGDAVSGSVPQETEGPYRTETVVTVSHNTGNLAKPGFQFAYWQDEADGSIYYPDDKIKLDRDKVLVAIFEQTEFYVSFDTQHEEAVNPESRPVIYGQSYGPLPDAELAGYLFLGWFTQPQGGELIRSDTLVAIKGNHTLYAHWKKIYQVKVKHVNKAGQALTQPDDTVHIEEGAQIEVMPVQIDNYKAVYYRIAGKDEIYSLDEKLLVTADLSIEIVYASTIIAVEMPKEVEFTSRASDEGDIHSADYKITNQSELPVMITFSQLEPIPGAMDDIDLVEAAENNSEMHLNLLTSDQTEENGWEINLYNVKPDEVYDTHLGTLSGTVMQGTGEQMTGVFGVGGRYAGPYSHRVRKPQVRFIFRIELIKGDV